MDVQQQKFIRMTQSPVKPLIAKLAIPTILSMLVTTFYNMADTFFVGMLQSDSITGAVGVVFAVMSVIQAVGFFFGHGSGNFVSRELGKKNVREAERMVSVGFFTALITGAVLGALGLAFIEPLAKLLGATPTILPYAKKYMTPILIGAPFMCASLVLNNQLRFQGNALYAMLGIVSGAVLNIALDPLFIFTFDMGIAGAGWATILSQAISFCLLLIGVQKSDTLKVRFANFRFEWQYIKNIATGGTPSLCRQGIGSLATICLNNMAGPYGDAAVAAFAVVQRIMMFASSALIGFGQGFQPVCGFNWGAKRFDRVRESYRYAGKMAFWGAAVMALVLALLAQPITALFAKDDPELLRLGTLCIQFQCVALPIHAWVAVVNMLCAGLGYGGLAFLLATSRQGSCFLPILYPMAFLLGELGIISVQAAADVLTLLLAVPVCRVVLRRIDRAEQQGELHEL